MELPGLPDGWRPSFRLSTQTRWSDEDNHGVVNNAVYLTLMEEARLAYFRGLDLMEGERFPFLLAQANVRFVKPGRGGAAVLVECSTVHLGETSFRQVYRVRAAANGEIWCEAEALLVAYDEARGGKVPLSDRFRERVETLERSGSSV